jgi:hypothetical protein
VAKPPDYSTWLTEQETAAKLRVSQKEVQRWAKAGLVRFAKRKQPEGGKAITVYDPIDVECIGADRDPLSGPPPSHIYLPNTCPENRKHHAHLKLLTYVDPYAGFALGFEGRLLWPGVRLAAEQLGRRPLVLEFAGPQGNRKPRRYMWILWKYVWRTREWIEIARTTAADWSWAVALRPLAVRELAAPLQPNVIPSVRGRALADELLTAVDKRLTPEPLEVQTFALSALYDGIAGRIVRIERECSAAAGGPRFAESADGTERKPTLAEVQEAFEELLQAIEEVPRDGGAPSPEPKPKPIQAARGPGRAESADGEQPRKEVRGTEAG